jgi:hypothetical protein
MNARDLHACTGILFGMLLACPFWIIIIIILIAGLRACH